MRPAPVLALVVAAASLGGVLAWRGLGRGPEDERRAASRADDEAAAKALQAALVDLKAADSAGPEAVAARRRAEAALEALIVARPSDPVPVFWRGAAALLARDRPSVDAAVGRIATVSKAGVNDPRVAYLKAVSFVELDPPRPDLGLRILRTLRAEWPSFEPQLVEGALYRALVSAAVARPEPEHLDDSIRWAVEASKLAEDVPIRRIGARRILAQLYERARRFPEAEETWAALVEETRGELPEVVFGYGNVLAQQNQWERAVEVFSRLVDAPAVAKVPPTSVVHEARMRRGNCLRLLGRNDDAKADLERYLADHPDDHRGAYWLGMLWLDGYEDPGRAATWIEKALAAAPWCDGYADVLLQIFEVRKPDAEKAAAVRKDRDAHAEEHRKTRERLMRERRDGTYLCQ
ncbi:MAG: tetratricopeptide repeat protein [Planctomycetes bacterium]|nr:tetratricopeptide repeat protein [Planctomycetota bacterium]